MSPLTYSQDTELDMRLRGSLGQFSKADLRAVFDELDAQRKALRDFIGWLEDEDANRDGELLGSLADPRCRECTYGTTPDRDKPRPCAYHIAKAAVTP